MHFFATIQNLHLVLGGHLYYVALTYGALLEIYQPLLKAMDVQNVLTHGNLHQVFFILKVLQTQSTLLLLLHVGVHIIVRSWWLA